MTEPIIYIILIALALSPVIRLLWLKAMQPIRLRLACLGNEILSDPDIPADQKEVVEVTLDDAYNWKVAFALAIFATPVGAFIAISKLIGADEVLPDSAFKRLSRTDRGERYVNQYILCTMLSNPIFALLGFVQLTIVLLILTLSYWSAKKAISAIESNVFGYFATAKRL